MRRPVHRPAGARGKPPRLPARLVLAAGLALSLEAGCPAGPSGPAPSGPRPIPAETHRPAGSAPTTETHHPTTTETHHPTTAETHHPTTAENRPPRRPAELRLISWNLKHLGWGEKRLDLVARVISHYDLAVLQEVMSQKGVDQLLADLPGWAAAVSPRAVGHGGYAEHYAVLYRKGLVRLQRSFTVPDPRDRFAREPFVVCLAAHRFDFCLLDIHVVFGSSVKPRDAEIDTLAELLADLERHTKERDWMVVGDFNRPARAPCFAWLARRGWRVSTGVARLLTSLSKTGYRSDYDHLVLDPRATREWRGDTDRIDVVRQVCRGDFSWCITNVSDHAPIHASFAIDGADDD